MRFRIKCLEIITKTWMQVINAIARGEVSHPLIQRHRIQTRWGLSQAWRMTPGKVTDVIRRFQCGRFEEEKVFISSRARQVEPQHIQSGRIVAQDYSAFGGKFFCLQGGLLLEH